MKSVLIVDDEPGIQSFFLRGLTSRFDLIETAGDVKTASALLERCHFDLIISDIRLPDRTGVEWVTELRDKGNLTPVIFITAYASLETAIDALRVGAMDFILKPFRLEQILAAIDRCLETQQLRRENFVLRRQLEQHLEVGGIIGECEAVHSVCQIIRQVARMPSTVLIEGESGTGKELAARAIHELSQRKGNFVSVNCGAMTAELMESELFGHVKGSFTGAHQAREGLFAYANGGTLFLDEIGEMPLTMQVHLLRVLEEQRIRPVGSNRETPIDVRILAATNRELVQRVKEGLFRQDLFYRLNVLSIRLPPLRERGQDVDLLAHHFSKRLSGELGVNALPLDRAEIMRLQAYDWPGNVRELKNVIERALLLGIMPSQCLAGTPSGRKLPVLKEEALLLEDVEKQHILRVLALEDSNKSAAARQLGISRKTLERKLNGWALE
ncbi:sigma-54-dependent Fis family transcriptional regulator [Thiothrix litoralis]|uniref:Sigma-54-dependent Fis family transcriptional regulator n=1 Tax=Thiothrix litoralis TaxID=2891210 RepID=A0ABX7WNN4_9GAMM|nr:sigma-54 dependent transcriptional regulator [Thiothrix litoralis]QTR45050.1 sigma-54-dependent Fis family transcriptional regulator [Thiothrix litoralis]